MHKIIIYTLPTCSYCIAAKAFLKEHKIKYTEKDVSTDQRAVAEMKQKSGQLATPVLDIDGNIVIGFDEERIKELLGL